MPITAFGQSLPAMPECADAKTAKLRSEKLDTYVDQIETAVEANNELLKKPEYIKAVRLVAAYLLPEDTMFRRFETECWAFFEEARQSLKQGQISAAKEQSDRWLICLKHRDDDSAATAAPLTNCLAPAPKAKNTK